MTRIAWQKRNASYGQGYLAYNTCDGENTMVMSTIYKLLNSEKPSCTKGVEQILGFPLFKGCISNEITWRKKAQTAEYTA